MIISDLEVLEVVCDENVEGGYAAAEAYADAKAKGKYFAVTLTDTYTDAFSGKKYSSAKSSSSSLSVAD